jgi:NAD(P)-dependent dehydrogenase (short-subunit alcohol dehydrogenase family)
MTADDPTRLAALEPGLRVLVTAGAAGIGRAIAEAFALHGARLLICDVDERALAEAKAAHPDWRTVVCDVADQTRVDAMFDLVDAELGGLDVLVNNAGIAGPTGPVEAIDPDDWRRTIDVNLTGAFLCARRAVPHLIESRGLMINLSSVAGRLGFANRSPYAASKWAIVGFTHSLAKELGPKGVRVNAIQPGVVAGPRIERVIQARADLEGHTYAEQERRRLEQVSLRRMVTAEDIAAMALFLAGPGGRNITGQALSVCAGVETI